MTPWPPLFVAPTDVILRGVVRQAVAPASPVVISVWGTTLRTRTVKETLCILHGTSTVGELILTPTVQENVDTLLRHWLEAAIPQSSA